MHDLVGSSFGFSESHRRASDPTGQWSSGPTILVKVRSAHGEVKVTVTRWRFSPAAATYLVVHAPAVAVREKPTTRAPTLRYRRPGDEVHAYGVVDGWIKCREDSGWMLLESEEFGTLLEPRRRQARE